MTNSVTFPVNLGGDGSTVTDDDNASTGLGNGGHRTRFVPAMGQVVAVANVLTQRLAAQSDTSTTSTAIASGSKSFTTAGFYEWAVGMYVVVASAANPTNLMYGQVTSWTTATNVLVVNVLSVGGSGTYSDWTLSLAGPPNLSTLPAIISVTSTSAALRVTQLGTGNALLIEDSTNPDSTPVVVDASGNLVSGHTAALEALAGVTPQTQIHGTTNGSAAEIIARWSADASPSTLSLAKSRGAVPGTYTIVASGDDIGTLDFLGANGTAFIKAAQILVEVDGTPGAADMPGRLVFSTTADGASSPTERLRIDSSGNLGLGVTPSAWNSSARAEQIGPRTSVFNFNNSNTYLTHNHYINTSSQDIYLANDYATMYRQSSGIHYWYTAPSGTAGNAISFTQAMTLDASGNLLVGRTSTGLTNAGAGFNKNAGGATLEVVQGGNGVACAYLNQSYGTGGQTVMDFRYNNTQVGTINVTSTTCSYNNLSDQRLKENIVDSPSALTSVNAIKVRSFDWKEEGSHVDYGYIAQELLEVVPEAVSVPADPDEMMGVDFGKLTPRLVKAIQELSAELNDLKQKVNA